MDEIVFAFIDAVIAGDTDLALKLAYEYEQGEQTCFEGLE